MNPTTVKAEDAKPIIGIDLAKKHFQLARADAQRRIQSRHRLSRTKLVEFMINQPPSEVVMEACGSAQYWARRFLQMGHEAKLLPAQHVKAYVRRNKTDAADAAALVEASGCEDIKPVAIKTEDQQVLQQLHRFRSRWQEGRTARINGLRGSLREFGIDIAKGAERGIAEITEALQLANNGLPDALRPLIAQVLKEIDDIEEQVKSTEPIAESPDARGRGSAAYAHHSRSRSDCVDRHEGGDPRHQPVSQRSASIGLAECAIQVSSAFPVKLA